jgi:hypothetical protein
LHGGVSAPTLPADAAVLLAYLERQARRSQAAHHRFQRVAGARSKMRMDIQEFGISNDNQVKKEMLLNWLMQQKIGDRHLTRNIADSMATLVRLPESQRGGNKKWIKAAK